MKKEGNKNKSENKKKSFVLWITWIILIIIILLIFIFLFYAYFSITGKAVVSEKFICSDSDDGKNYGVQGVIKQGDLIKGTDYCTTDTRLKEYYCLTETSTSHNYYECPYKCVKGACVEEQTANQGNQEFEQISNEEKTIVTEPENKITQEPKPGFFKRIVNNIKRFFQKS